MKYIYKKFVCLICLIIIIFFSYSSSCFPQKKIYEIHGKVTKIIDGDTIKMVNQQNKTPYKVRIAHIDAPEIDQKFGLEAKKFLLDRIYNRDIIIKYYKKDKYGRIISDVLYNRKKNNIGKEILENGLAWVWHYSNNKKYKLIELNAKKNKIGLWKYKNNLDPFLWRKNKKLK